MTGRLSWFLDCLGHAVANADIAFDRALFKARLRDTINRRPVNERQCRVISRMLDDGFEGFMHTSKYAKLARCSSDATRRDSQQLKARGILIENPGGGRSTSCRLPTRDDQAHCQ